MVKKSYIAIGVMMCVSFLIGASSFADTIPTTAVLSSATGIEVTVSPINGITDEWQSPVSTIDFGTLKEVSGVDSNGDKWSYFGPGNDYYYAVEVAWAGGANPASGSIYVQVSNIVKPASLPADDFGLATRSTATFVKTAISTWPATEDQFLSFGKKLLEDLQSPATVTATDISGGWLRMYVGLVTNDPDALIPDPADAKSFSAADPAGLYSADLSITFSL